MIIGKRKHTVSPTAASGHATCHADVIIASARSQPYADIILAVDDVRIDLVNVDQVNRSIGVCGQGQLGPHVGHSASLTGGTHTSD